MQNIKHHTCSNGLQLITEFIPNVQTVALNWSVRAGVATNTNDGESVLLAELIQRGVLHYNAKEHNDALDAIGVSRQITCGIEFIRISSIMLGNRLYEALPLLGAYFLHPSMPENELQACKSLSLQSIQSLADNPNLLGTVELNKQHFPPPFNRSAYGNPACIESATIEQLQAVYTELFIPNNSVLVLTGNVDYERVVGEVEQLISGWDSGNKHTIKSATPTRGAHWVEQESAQAHLSFAFDAPNAEDEHSILESTAISVFGGATRLCYSVSAQYLASKERSVVRVHAGTTPERADETAQVCLDQLMELKDGITEKEFDRTIQRMKSRTVMNGESTAQRAAALWGDQFALGKTRSLADRLEEIDAITFSDVNDWLSKRSFGEMTFISVGPKSVW
jgi:predicted Zn-dependent peptidase